MASTTTKWDWLKWTIAAILIVAGLVANYYYSQFAWPLRLLAWLFLMLAVLVIALQTFQGRQALEFARDSRIELRKVVWPTRQETIQTTAIVMVMVAVTGLILWVVDSGMMWVIAKITHLG